MERMALTVAGVCVLVGAAQAQVTLEPIATGYVGTDISADGEAIAGNVTLDGSYETFRWTSATGVVRLGRSTVIAFGTGAGHPNISYDGTRVSATIADATTTFETGGVWDESFGWTDCMPPLLPDSVNIDGAYCDGWGLSGDGQTLVGLYWSNAVSLGSAHAYTWNTSTGSAGLSAAGTPSSRANDANYDGSVVVGWQSNNVGAWQPTAWRGGVKHLLSDTDILCMAEGTNADGSIIVGNTAIGPVVNESRHAAFWTWNGASYDETIIGNLPGTPAGPTGRAWANSIADDAMIIVGSNNFFDNGPFSVSTGFVWTPRTGMFDVVDYLGDNGIALPAGIQVSGLTSISADASTILLILQDTTTFELSTALLHIPVACSAADITTQGAAMGNTNFGMPDGLVTAADIQYYVNLYVLGDLNADLTTQGAGSGDPGFGVPDGLVTAADIQYYVNLYVAGCP